MRLNPRSLRHWERACFKVGRPLAGKAVKTRFISHLFHAILCSDCSSDRGLGVQIPPGAPMIPIRRRCGFPGDDTQCSTVVALCGTGRGGSMQQVSRLGVFSLSVWVCWGAPIAAFAVFGETAPARAASPLTRVVISYPNPNPRVAPLWVAQDLDFFSKYGVTGEVVFVRNNQTLIAGIAAGEIDVGYAGGATDLRFQYPRSQSMTFSNGRPSR